MGPKSRILYVDDEENNLFNFKNLFKWEYDVITVTSGAVGLRILKEEEVHLIVTDQRMPNMSGIEFLKKAIKVNPFPERIIVTAYGDLSTITEAVNECAIFRYIAKPWREEDMKLAIDRALESYHLKIENRGLIKRLKLRNSELQRENRFLRGELHSNSFINLTSKNREFKEILKRVKKLAPSSANVLIRGETGTGKELMANMIHGLSSRTDAPFIKLNCAALPENLIESELFGHEKGAFTGAETARAGRFELADGGTIFLDEIAEMSNHLQSKLLRVIQEGEFTRLGGEKSVSIDVRIIAATNKDLELEMKHGSFREDLYYRLNVFEITCLPLRERREDIADLAKFFIAKYKEKANNCDASLSKKDLDYLFSYEWPGNIRELENTIERSLILSQDGKLELDWLVFNKRQDSEIEHFDQLDLKDLEKRHIAKVLKMCNWKVSGPNGAAEILGLNPKTLFSKIEKHGIKRPRRS
ncbi:MAG: sigma-54 dependent transcriptional regulator [Bacteroidota bacterium]